MKTMIGKMKRGFTLIELLVVIAVIAVLMDILLPSLRLAREKVRIIVCGNNQRQLLVGLASYATENDDKLPPSSAKLGTAGAARANYHHPMELNFHYSNGWGPMNPGQDRNYEYTGKYLGSYLPEVDVFNCKVAPIDPKSPWPPPGSTYEPVSTYGGLYKTGEWAPLHSTYMLLWNYQGYNPDISPAVFQSGGYTTFIGPKKGSSPVKLVVQDALMFKTDTFVLFPGANVGNSWYSSHQFKGACRTKDYPFYNTPRYARSEVPEVWLNAGYLDGHVSRFNSRDAYRVGANAHDAMITKVFR